MVFTRSWKCSVVTKFLICCLMKLAMRTCLMFLTAVATVTAIDRSNSRVTLRYPDGKEVTTEQTV